MLNEDILREIESGEFTSKETVKMLVAEFRKLQYNATRASAELRHAFKQEQIDRNLVSRSIRLLEEVTTPKP